MAFILGNYAKRWQCWGKHKGCGWNRGEVIKESRTRNAPLNLYNVMYCRNIHGVL